MQKNGNVQKEYRVATFLRQDSPVLVFLSQLLA